MLALIALFIWMGADAEARAIRAKAGLVGVPVAAVMVRRFAAVDPDDTLEAVADYSRQTFQHRLPSGRERKGSRTDRPRGHPGRAGRARPNGASLPGDAPRLFDRRPG